MSKASDATKGEAPSEDGFAAERRPTLSRPAGWRNPAIKVLCRSARYTISKEYELAFVEGEGCHRSGKSGHSRSGQNRPVRSVIMVMSAGGVGQVVG
jgi:hypothetical protein